MDQADTPNIIQQQIDSIGILRLNRVEVLNALDKDTMRDLVEATRYMAENPEIRCVILTGEGRAFCAGGDRRAMSNGAAKQAGDRPKSTSNEERAAWIERSSEAALLLHQMDKPTIAMINGPCAGAGLSLAGACDFRIAAQSAVFAPAFLSVGMPGDYGGSWFWTQILGTAKARQLYFLIDRMTAQEAMDFGLLHQLVADDVLETTVMDIARRLVKIPATSVALTKQNLNAALYNDVAEHIALEARNTVAARAALIAAEKQRRALQGE